MVVMIATDEGSFCNENGDNVMIMVLAVGDEDGASENDNCDGFVHFSITMT